jgi:hypothetical protein
MNSSKTARSGPTIAQKKTDHSKGHVLIIALVGFVIGVVWPRLAGVSLVPEAPVEDEVQSDEDDAQATAKTAVPQEPELIELLPEDRLQVSPAKITSCVQGKDKAAKCDEIKVDDLVHPHLMALLGCPSAQGVFGTLSLGFRLDFEQAKISEVESGRSTDLPEETTKEILRCATQELSTVSLNGLSHQFDSYQVFYLLEFKTPEAAAQDKTSVTPASGKATVQWRTALIREEADRDAKVVARLLTGAVIVVTGRMGEWYRIKYDDKGREGWVHGAAIGLKGEPEE